MTNTRSSIVEQPDERGSALIGVLLLLMMMSALAAALGVSGQTETLISRNQRSGAQAQAAAEAGLNHAVELATTYIFEWNANRFANVEAAIDALLLGPDLASGSVGTNADNGSLGTRPGITAAEDIPLGTRLTITGGINAEYEAFIMDDAGAALGEEGVDDPLNDTNETLIVRATGYGPDNTKVVLEAVISYISLPAVVVNGDLTISGNATIAGTEGSVHANADLTISGGAATVSGTVTASGTYTGSLPGSGGAAPLPIPLVRASDHRFKADFVLESNGTITCGASAGCAGGYAYGATICGASPCNYWVYNAGDNSWTISGNDATNGTYYVEGPARISGNAGTTLVPIAITIIAEGSIEISGNPDLAPDYPELLFVTDGDLKISGGIDTPLVAAGQMLVHEQVSISGNPSLSGQLLVENATSVDPLVTNNTISGNPTITYNGGLGEGVYSVTGWREIR
jgi:hypothetical protein